MWFNLVCSPCFIILGKLRQCADVLRCLSTWSDWGEFCTDRVIPSFVNNEIYLAQNMFTSFSRYEWCWCTSLTRERLFLLALSYAIFPWYRGGILQNTYVSECFAIHISSIALKKLQLRVKCFWLTVPFFISYKLFTVAAALTKISLQRIRGYCVKIISLSKTTRPWGKL